MSVMNWSNDILVSETRLGLQGACDVAVLADGRIVVAWCDYSNGLTSLLGRFFSETGAPLGPAFTINNNLIFSQSFGSPDILPLADGGFRVAYERKFSNRTDRDIVVATLDGAGAIVGMQDEIAATANDEFMPHFENEGASVTFVEDVGTTQNIRAHDFGVGDYNIVEGLTAISGYGVNISILHTSDIIRSGQYVVLGDNFSGYTAVSQGLVPSAPSDVETFTTRFGTIYSHYGVYGDGYSLKLVHIENAATTAKLGGMTDVARIIGVSYAQGMITVAWSTHVVDGQSTAYAQSFTMDGSVVGRPIVLNSSQTGVAGQGDVAMLRDGRIVVAYDFGADVQMRIIDPRDGVVTGTATSDTLFGNNLSSDEIAGLSGDDRIWGLNGDDVLFGNDGADSIQGGNGNDILYGGAGADLLGGGAGDDEQYGEAGNDILVASPGADILSGGDGFDAANFVASPTAVVVSLDGSLVGTGWALDDTMSGVERLIGSNVGADRLRGDALANQLEGYGGNDTLEGMAGDDRLIGGVGADVMNGGAGADRYYYFSIAEFGDRIVYDANDGFMLDDAIGGGLAIGQLPDTAFEASTTNIATGAMTRIIFETDTAMVWFDRDGAGGVAPVMIADLQAGAPVTAADFRIF